MPLRHRLVVGALGISFVVASLAIAALAVEASGRGDRVARNVKVAGVSVGGLNRARLAAVMHDLAGRYASAPVDVRAPKGGITATGSEIGLAVDQGATAEAALRVDRGGWLPARMWRAARAFLRTKTVPVATSVDTRAVAAVIGTRDKGPRSPPVEPSLALKGDHLAAVAGKPGRGIDPDAVAAAVRRAASHGTPVHVSVDRGAVRPQYSVADAQQLVPAAESLTAAPLTVAAGASTATLPPPTLKAWMRALPGDDGLVLGLDPDAVTGDLAKILSGATTQPVDAKIQVVGGQVQVTPSKPGTVCCEPDAALTIKNALEKRPAPNDPVDLPVRTLQPKRTTDQVKSWGIKEQVATFTTNHAGGEPRVTNIHRIADLVRGAVIAPGDSLSINGLVGPRAPEKGFVDAPVIGEGNKFSTSPGGGVSQFATTLFNAGFFAGMDMPEYQMHSLYISRYPYGREATLSFPHPDLIIRNPSPYGVLVWTSYTDTSITVTLYSTHWVDADQTGQTKADKPATPAPDRPPDAPPLGTCTAVTTERTRKYVSDGHTSVDYFRGLYHPEEGAGCAS